VRVWKDDLGEEKPELVVDGFNVEPAAIY